MIIPASAIHSDGDGSALDCHIQPGAARTRIVGEYDRRLKVAVAAPPVDGKANRALIVFFSTVLHIPAGRISVKSGESGRRKRLIFSSLAPDILRNLLEQVSDAGK